MIAFGLLRDIILVGAGAVGALTLEHGWGWVLARYHADAAKAQAAFDARIAKVASPLLEQRLSAIESKLGIVHAAQTPAAPASPTPAA